MLIGQLAELTGASPKAIRNYEALGLIGPVQRVGGYRYYSEADAYRVGLIRRAQGVGFTLAELKAMLLANGEIAWPVVLGLMAQKREQLAQAMAELQRQQAELHALHQELTVCCAGLEGTSLSV